MTDNNNKKYTLKVSSTRTNQEITGFRKDFEEAVSGENGDYTMDVSISITAADDAGNEENVAYFRGLIYNEEGLEKAGLDYKQVAQNSKLDITGHAYWLMESGEYKNKAKEFVGNDNCWSGYILTWFIYPDYRNEGIATFLIENLAKILKRSIGIDLRCASIFPHPQNEGTWETVFDPDMMFLMIDTMEDHGFKPSGNDGYHVKSYEYVG